MEPSRIDETLSDSERQEKRQPLKIWRPLENLNPARRNLLFLAPTRAVYELWRRSQKWRRK